MGDLIQNGVAADVGSVDEVTLESGGSLIQHTGGLVARGHLDAHAHSVGGEGHVEVEAGRGAAGLGRISGSGPQNCSPAVGAAQPVVFPGGRRSRWTQLSNLPLSHCVRLSVS